MLMRTRCRCLGWRTAVPAMAVSGLPERIAARTAGRRRQAIRYCRLAMFPAVMKLRLSTQYVCQPSPDSWGSSEALSQRYTATVWKSAVPGPSVESVHALTFLMPTAVRVRVNALASPISQTTACLTPPPGPRQAAKCRRSSHSSLDACASLQFGRIKYIDLKTPLRPPAFAFVEYEDPRYMFGLPAES